jgi:predicted PurR-regulated permease PerM
MERKQTGFSGGNALLVAACLVVVVAGLKMSAGLVLPFLIALFVAAVSLPLLHAMQRRGVPTWLAVLVTILADLVALGGMVALIGGSVADFTDQVPRYQAALRQNLIELLNWVRARGIPVSNEVITDMLDAGRVLTVVTGTLRGVAAVLSNSLLVVLAVVFILAEAACFPAKIEVAFGKGRGQARFANMRNEVQRYLGLKTLISLTTGSLVASAMAIIGVDFPLLWGMLAFLLNYIPALGSILAAVPPVLLAIVQPELGLGSVLAVAIVFLSINICLGNFLEPYVMGRGLGMSPLVVFVSLLFWGWVWGPVGMLVSVPMTMIIKIMLENTEDLRWVAVLLGPAPKGPVDG